MTLISERNGASDPPGVARTTAAPEALVEEARRRQRRRYRWTGAAVTATAVGLVIGLVWSGGSGSGPPSPTTDRVRAAGSPSTVHGRIRSLVLAGPFSPDQIVAANGTVWLVGSIPSRSGPSRCAIEAVNATTFRRRLYPGPACGPNVAVSGDQIYLTDVTYVSDSNDEQIQIERFDTVTRRATVLAPVDMTLAGSAIAHTSMIYSNGSLWLWGNEAPSRGSDVGHDEVVQISAATGAVLRTITGVPAIGGIQPSMVIVDGALWLAGGAGGGPDVERITSTAPAPTVVYAAPPNSDVLWLSAVGTRVLAEEVTAGTHPATRLVVLGANGQQIAGTTPSDQNLAETAAVGTGRQRWAVGAGQSCHAPLRLWRIDAATGAATSALTLLSSDEPCVATTGVAVTGQSVFALVTGTPAPAKLFRLSEARPALPATVR